MANLYGFDWKDALRTLRVAGPKRVSATVSEETFGRLEDFAGKQGVTVPDLVRLGLTIVMELEKQ